jgi:hypothetical protein
VTDEKLTPCATTPVGWIESAELVKEYVSPSSGELWPFQYRRMRRSLRRLEALANGERFGDGRDSEDATDALIHFFQDAFHLKDWVKHDITATKTLKDAAEDLFCSGGTRCRRQGTHDPGPLVMRLCADMCNGAKHQRLNDDRRLPDSSMASEHVKVGPFTAEGGKADRPPRHSWTVLADGEELDALTTAYRIVYEWDRWLVAKGQAAPR